MSDKLNRAIAVNAINRRLTAVGRPHWGEVEIQALDIIIAALDRVTNEENSKAYAVGADITPPPQTKDEMLEKAAEVLPIRAPKAIAG